MGTASEQMLIVWSNFPDQQSAELAAQTLIAARAAACVNLLAPVQSWYEWEGKVERATEIPLMLKTTARAYPQVETLLRASHPYKLPEIVAVPVTQGLPEYLDWVARMTIPPSPVIV
ncbi:divalent-cation tolerance protein CutA [Parvibium lacunae]|uniref:Divalent-cation tolerance protein CutA n=1 Tax=Parvibium lacunae TaxID=1888893 RepID=A0A368KYX0_9BURK|nr:divalent-cation tolerance protein CutA [Parvibium lacunae]RCS56608.1 divalent-cation tolerance protein CutA [Parvibium lacunae]